VTTTDPARVAAARRWFRALGHRANEADGVTVVATPEHPTVWEANWAAAGAGATPGDVFAALDRWFGGSPWRVVYTDALTPPAVEAALALADFTATGALIEMAAVAPPVAPRPAIVPVDAANWDRLASLVAQDHREGARTGPHDPAVASGLLEGMRRRLDACAYWLIEVDGEAAGYGLTAICPHGLGLIEDLFTAPAWRGRGLMSGFIAAMTERLLDAGCDAVFLDAFAEAAPKRLYARLGFAPVAVTRQWVRRGTPAG
jgi:GNAT superfamily N-acetyltransferase